MSYQNPMSQTPVVSNLLIANIVAYLATMLLDTNDIYALFALFPVGSPFFELWQPVTYMFLHGDFSHLSARLKPANLSRELLVRAARIKGAHGSLTVE
jgi:membrane associated rhomboid family serine protease